MRYISSLFFYVISSRSSRSRLRDFWELLEPLDSLIVLRVVSSSDQDHERLEASWEIAIVGAQGMSLPVFTVCACVGSHEHSALLSPPTTFPMAVPYSWITIDGICRNF